MGESNPKSHMFLYIFMYIYMYTQPLVIQLYRQICWFPVRRSASSAQVYPPACTWEKPGKKLGLNR